MPSERILSILFIIIYFSIAHPEKFSSVMNFTLHACISSCN